MSLEAVLFFFFLKKSYKTLVVILQIPRIIKFSTNYLIIWLKKKKHNNYIDVFSFLIKFA